MLSLEYYYKVLLLLKMSSTWYNEYVTFVFLLLYYSVNGGSGESLAVLQSGESQPENAPGVGLIALIEI